MEKKKKEDQQPPTLDFVVYEISTTGPVVVTQELTAQRLLCAGYACRQFDTLHSTIHSDIFIAMSNTNEMSSASSRSHQHEHESRLSQDEISERLVPVELVPPTTINSLPPEILLLILDVIVRDKSNFDIQDLSSLSLTNWRFHQLVADKLYRCFEPGVDPYYFIRTLILRPDLAEHVKKVSLAFMHNEHRFDGRERFHTPTAGDMAIIKAGMRLTEIHDWKAWAEACNCPEADDDALYSAVLMHAANIEELEIEIDPNYEGSHL